MKILLRFLAILIILAAAPVAFVASWYDGPYAVLTPPEFLPRETAIQMREFVTPMRPMRETMKALCYGSDAPFRGFCEYSTQGLGFFLKVSLGVIALGLLLFFYSFTRSKPKPIAPPKGVAAPASVPAPAPAAAAGHHAPAAADTAAPATDAPAASKPAPDAEAAAAAQDAPSEAAADSEEGEGEEHHHAAVIDAAELEALERQLSGGAGKADEDKPNPLAAGVFNIPEELRTGQFEDEKFFYNINKVVAAAQTNPEESVLIVGITVLRPEFLPHMDKLTDSVKKRIGRQVMQYHAMRLKRAEKHISPIQFASQDRRMSEVDRETICRRFLPKNAGHVPEDARHHIGRVYTLTEQYQIQQSTQSGADDWQDVSLRTLVSVMKLPVKPS